MKLAADANVLLSARLGGRVKWILNHPSVPAVVTAETTFQAVQEYPIQLARKGRLALNLILLTMAAMPVEIAGRGSRRRYATAARAFGDRDQFRHAVVDLG